MSYGAAAASITGQFLAEWEDRTPVEYPNTSIDPAGATHVSIRITSQEAFNASLPAALVRYPGMVLVDIRAPLGSGDGEAIDLADAAAAIFRNLTFDDITFRAPTVRDFGPSGGWYLVQVTCPFTRTTIH